MAPALSPSPYDLPWRENSSYTPLMERWGSVSVPSKLQHFKIWPFGCPLLLLLLSLLLSDASQGSLELAQNLKLTVILPGQPPASWNNRNIPLCLNLSLDHKVCFWQSILLYSSGWPWAHYVAWWPQTCGSPSILVSWVLGLQMAPHLSLRGNSASTLSTGSQNSKCLS